MPRKICLYCKQRKNLKSFPKHIGHKDNLDSRCRKCIKKETKIRNKLHKKAPDKPEYCESCKEYPTKWALDHDHNNKKFRGWLCSRCNEGLGKLGDDIHGVLNAVNYLLKRSELSADELDEIKDQLIYALNNVLDRKRKINET